MFTQEHLQKLLSFNGQEHTFLSLYLNTDTTQRPIETIKLEVKNLIKEAGLSSEEAAALEKYIEYSYDWSKPGLAAFATTDDTFFEAYPVAVSFNNRLRVGKKPYLKPLTHLLDYYAHYGVVVVDRVGARFFAYHLGEVQETEGIMGEEIHKQKSGGGSSSVGVRGGQSHDRHEEEVAQRNLREAAEAAQAFFAKHPIRRLFLGGTAETVAQFRELLSKQLQACVAGTFAMDMDAGEYAIRKQSLSLLRHANAEREDLLVKTMITTEAKAGAAVIGLDAVLQAVNEKRVQTLVMSDGYRAPGFVDETSGYVVANLALSPIAPSDLTAVDDVMETAVSQTLQQGGHVEVITGHIELEAIGRIGAILRY